MFQYHLSCHKTERKPRFFLCVILFVDYAVIVIEFRKGGRYLINAVADIVRSFFSEGDGESLTSKHDFESKGSFAFGIKGYGRNFTVEGKSRLFQD